MKKFLYLPFKKQDYQITEGWIYSQEEQKIHGFNGHGGVDFKLPRGTPVLASNDGWAIASYYNFLAKEKMKLFGQLDISWFQKRFQVQDGQLKLKEERL